MFHFPTFPPHALYIQARVTPHNRCWVPPFGNPRITVRLSTPRGLSQIPTSFIGSWCQGIHHVPLKTWPQQNKDARVHYTILKQHTPHTNPTTTARPAQNEQRDNTPNQPQTNRASPACSLRTQQRADTHTQTPPTASQPPTNRQKAYSPQSSTQTRAP